MLAQLEEIAMCHHAINAAHHDALSAERSMEQDAYYLYIVNVQSHLYPVPERCKEFDTTWILSYMKMNAAERNELDESVFDQIGMKVTGIAADAEFLGVVVNKMSVEGSKAALWENRNKDIPSNP
jgi:hypothetical protein